MSYFIDGRPDHNGAETDRRARQYAQEHGVSYVVGLNHVVQQEQRNFADVTVNNSDKIIQLNNLVCGLPRLANGEIDIKLALRTINSIDEYRLIGQAAAGQFLVDQAHLLRQRRNITPAEWATENPGRAMLESLLAEVVRIFPAVAATDQYGRMSEETLKTILLPKFNDANPPSIPHANDAEVRKYGGDDHVRYDAAGREYHVHSFNR